MKVAVLMGSPRDGDKMAPAAETLARFGIEADVRVLSAHRNPAEVAQLAGGAREAGYVAFICGAGMAAHLAGVVAAHTTLPVVGVPLPFISYGGTHLVTLLSGFGVLMAIQTHRKWIAQA